MKYYNPQSDLEKEIFPNLGLAEITDGISEYIGKKGIIVEEDNEAARIVFPNFWFRPDGMDPIEANDSTWCFHGEYRRIA